MSRGPLSLGIPESWVHFIQYSDPLIKFIDVDIRSDFFKIYLKLNPKLTGLLLQYVSLVDSHLCWCTQIMKRIFKRDFLL